MIVRDTPCSGDAEVGAASEDANTFIDGRSGQGTLLPRELLLGREVEVIGAACVAIGSRGERSDAKWLT